MQIALFVFEGITALDVVGPYEVLSRLPDAQARFVAKQAGTVRTDNGCLGLAADAPLCDATAPEIVVVPGGWGTRALEKDAEVLEWIRAVHARTRFTTSVCTGAHLLGAAGLLRGLEATTHWAQMERLREFGAKPVERRVVEQGKIITAAGVSSGIDMALALAARVAGDDVARAIQLSIEYDPEPPFDSGSLAKAPAHVVELVRRRTAAKLGVQA